MRDLGRIATSRPRYKKTDPVGEIDQWPRHKEVNAAMQAEVFSRLLWWLSMKTTLLPVPPKAVCRARGPAKGLDLGSR
jgi:hypothetical protein